MRAASVIGLLAMLAGGARAQPAEPVTAAEVKDAPRPDRASGRFDEIDRGPSQLRRAGQIALFVPRWTVWTAFAPIRLTLWAYQRYGIDHRIAALLSGPARISVHPLARYDSEFGIAFGARALNKNLLGAGETARLKVSLGGEFDRFASLKLGTGRRLGPLRLVFEADVKAEDKARFAGIGNASLDDDCMAVTMAGPRDATCQARFAQDVVRFELTGELRVIDRLLLGATSALLLREIGLTDSQRDPDVTEIYDTAQLVGYDRDLSSIYSEVSASYDDRAVHGRYESLAIPSAGWQLGAFAGYQAGVNGDPSRFFRYGLDVQRFFWLGSPSQVLALRVYGEAVSGDLDSDVPFVDLPTLGGRRLLRGFGTARFRDRAVGAASAEYHFPVQEFASVFAFVDTGRVFRSLRDVDVDELHLGYGGGLLLYSHRLLLLKFQAAYAHEEDTFQLSLSLEPTFRAKPRAQRY